MRYESTDDVKLRLGSSLVRKMDGSPVYVQGVESRNEVVVHNCHSGRKERLSVEELDLTPVPLGYVESDGEVMYVTRKPTRRYKQGLTTENMVVRDVMRNSFTRLPVNDKGLCKAIMNNYPKVEEAFQECRAGKRIVPFSREWAVANYKDDLCVMHKGIVVGYVGDDNVMLSPDKYFLKESLMESLNENNR